MLAAAGRLVAQQVPSWLPLRTLAQWRWQRQAAAAPGLTQYLQPEQAAHQVRRLRLARAAHALSPRLAPLPEEQLPARRSAGPPVVRAQGRVEL